jgi:hypothetical protein
MPVRVVAESQSNSQLVEQKTVVDTIEKNRDRARTLVTMMISTTSILFSANLAILALLKDRLALFSLIEKVLFIVSPLLLLASLITGLSAAFLRHNVSIVSSTKFIDDLLTQYNSELRLVRIGFLLLLLGLVCLCSGVFALTFLPR